MKDVVEYLRESWYGNGNENPDDHPSKKKPVDYQKLRSKFLKYAETKYVGLCTRISGEMGELDIDQNWNDEKVTLPIDTLAL